MTKRIIPQAQDKRKKLNDLLKGFSNFYGEDLEKMVYYCYSEFDATYEQIGQALGISRQAVMDRYPKEKKA